MSRPAAIVVACVVLLVLGAAELTFAWLVLVEGRAAGELLAAPAGEILAAAPALFGIGSALLGGVSIVVAGGLWLLRPWSLLAALGALAAVVVVAVVILLLGSDDTGSGVALALGIVAGAGLTGLLTAPVREVFEPDGPAGPPDQSAPLS